MSEDVAMMLIRIGIIVLPAMGLAGVLGYMIGLSKAGKELDNWTNMLQEEAMRNVVPPMPRPDQEPTRLTNLTIRNERKTY